ncbi:MAG: hypothetical protein HY318_12175 [Armatimonadetes bacterium]|nr:hypothetical protein [Armatimonadota bacterium]
MTRLSFLLQLVMITSLLSNTCAQDLTVPLPPGETPLEDIGLYRVCYQSYGKEVVEMPLSWTGHFTTDSGISFMPWGKVQGRSAILLHSPWKVPPGKVWVDYELSLPKITPLKFSFGIAIGAEFAVPGRSDGVTFSCYLVHGGKDHELMRKHQDMSEWIDYDFDLSQYAGKTVTLRLQTEPGPKNDSSWDYSFVGDAKFLCGTAKTSRAELIKRLTSTKAYQAAARVGVKPLSNSNKNGVVPSNLMPCRNSIKKVGDTYRFNYSAEDCEVVYTYEAKTGTLDDFSAQVDGSHAFQPAQGGGVTVELKEGDKVRQVAATGGKAKNLDLTENGQALAVDWEYDIQGKPLLVHWRFKILGKSLGVSTSCDQPIVSSFSLGHVGATLLRKTFTVPYMPADWSRGFVTYLSAENAFVCRYLDWTLSHASLCPQGEATYQPKTDGSRNPMMETGYVAVSPNINEVLPNAPHPPSPFLNVLGPRIMLDVWGHHDGTYKGDADNLRDLKDNGVDHLAIIQHVWQRYGYDVKLPDHIPAYPQFGGDEGMIEFGKAANECGYVWSVHENYIDLYPDAPSYDPTARVLWTDGSPSKAWFNAGTGVQSFGLKCNRALGYAKQNSPEIHKRYKTTAAYLDVHTCVPPWHQLDHEANQPMAAMALAKVKYDTELFQYMRDTHGGPLFGEGFNQFYWAGRCDGVEAQVTGGENHDPFLDFDLLKLHPQMVNHGMGYYERWFERGYNHRLGWDTGAPEQIDKYRAQELAYGHAGFIGSASTDNIQWVAREHHLMHAVQRLYGNAKPTDISYEVDGRFVSGSAALVMGDRGRQRIKYDSGLTLWVNWKKEPWTVQGRLLPQWGFLALGPATEVYTAMIDGKFADYAECPEYVFVDSRTSFNMPYLTQGKDIEPKLREFRYLGGNKIQATYEWVVNDSLDQDYHCFVHFTNAAAQNSAQIAFQQDHAVPKPTSQWQKGETLLDGPYTITVPEDQFDTYDLVLGLFKQERVQLKGVDAGGSRIFLGRLELERQDGKITNIRLIDFDEAVKQIATPKADFTAHLNPPGTTITFGKVATNGSIKIKKSKDGLTIFPYPRDRAINLSFDVKSLAANANLSKLEVRALEAGTQRDMGKAGFKIEKGRLSLSLGKKGAGRYVVRW